MAERSYRQQKTAKPTRGRKSEIIGILLICLSLVFAAALLTHDPGDWPNSSRSFDEPTHNLVGRYGAWASNVFVEWLGLTSYAVVLFMLIAGVVLFLHRSRRLLVAPAFFSAIVGVFLPLLIALTADIGSDNTRVDPAFRYGGILGGFVAHYLVTYLGRIGAYLLSLAAILITLVLTTNIRPSSVVDMFITVVRPIAGMVGGLFKRGEESEPRVRPKKRFETPVRTAPGDESPFIAPPEDIREPEISSPEEEPGPSIQVPTISTPAGEENGEETDTAATEEDTFDELSEQLETVPEEYLLPGSDMLDMPAREGAVESRDELLEQSRRIVESLKNFGIDAEVKNITPGPIVTRYEVTLAPGIKVGRVVGLSNDLSMALRAKGNIRIIAPIPGKAAIGIEVPNRSRSIVYIREIAESELFRTADLPLVLALGKNTAGDPVVADLAKMPHLLIAGSTGAGKSVCINTIIVSILMKATPRDVRMIMVDPKVVELNIYNPIPHLLTPVIHDPGRAANALKWAVREMESRYRKLASLGVRDIDQYNRRIDDIHARHLKEQESAPEDEQEETFEKSVLPERLPLVVIIIDEYADLMVLAAKEIEESISRIAQMARAVGMHLIIATQRPSADVITGLIKANFPSRIAFKVMQASNSRIILDEGGADKLLGMGDMLFLQVGKPEPVRLHGAYVSSEECARIVSFIEEHSSLSTDRIDEDELEGETADTGNSLGLRDPNSRDVLFYEAARLVVRHNQGSVSLLQRRLKVGYARAARLIDQLEIAGIVSAYDGSKAREVLVDDAYIDTLEAEDS